MRNTVAIEKANVEVLVVAEALFNLSLEGFGNCVGHDGLIAGLLRGRPGFECRAEAEHFVENAMGHFGLGKTGEREVAAIARENGDDVGVGIKAGAFGGDIVGNDDVGVFRDEFAAGVFGDVFSFRSEPQDETVTFFAGEGGEDVWIRSEAENEFAGSALDLLGRFVGSAIIGDGGGKDDDSGRSKALLDGREHLFGAADVDALDALGSFEGSRSRDEEDFGATFGGSGGESIAHFSGRAIGDEADRV